VALASIAFRNLRRQKKRSFLLGGAIAFGVLIVTIIDGFAGAFMQNVSENFANIAAGHIFVSGSEMTASGKKLSVIRDDTVLKEVLAKTGIPAKYVSKRSTARGTLIYESRKTQSLVQGVDFASETYLPERLTLLQGSFSAMKERQGIILSEPTVKRLGMEIGDRVLFQTTTLTGQQNVGEFVLVAVTPDSGFLSGFSAYGNLSYLSELLDMGQTEYESLGIYLPSLAGMDRYADEYYAELKTRANVEERKKPEAGAAQGFGPAALMGMGGEKEKPWEGVRYKVATLNDMLSSVKQIVNVLNGVSLAILLVLFVIIMVGILNTFRMTMYERIREIGTMRAVGMQRPQVRNLFLLEALFLALGGAVVGIALASVAMAIISAFNLGVNSPIFMLLQNGHLTFRVPVWKGAQNIGIIAILTLLAAWLPARSAARLLPAEALRTTK
jgi:putative ABC transport system permease protein